MHLADLNWLAVVVSAVAFYALGALWYSVLFGKAWAAELGIDTENPPEVNMVPTMGGTFVLALVAAIVDGGHDVAIGSRLKRGAQVVGRSPKREFISRSYSLIFRTMFLTSFQDAQCGFKAVGRRVVKEVLPLVKDTGWFFDTELLILCEKNGYSVEEVPVRWVDDPDSRVRIVNTAYEDLKGLVRLRCGGLRESRTMLNRLRQDS